MVRSSDPRRPIWYGTVRGGLERRAVAAVDNQDILDPAADGVLTGAQLRYHAGRRRALAHEAFDSRHIEHRGGRAVRTQNAGRRAGDGQPLRTKPGGEMPSQRVRVDIEQLP